MDGICCLLSGLLGNVRISERLVDVVERVSESPPCVIWFDADSYRRFRAPRFLRFSQEFEAELVMRRMLKERPLPHANTYVANTFHLAMAAYRRDTGARWVVATDATPALTARMRAAGFAESLGFARRAFRRVQESRFANFAPAVDMWLPMSDACRDSLVDDYGVEPGRCLVTRAPQPDIDAELVVRDPRTRPWRLLFVGNDFARKGGPQLCAAVEQVPDAVLTIVSRDPAALRFVGPRIGVLSGVTDRGEIAKLYRQAHLLIHPALVDHYPNVICEGLARGLPFLVSDATPSVELVQSSGGGRSLATPFSASTIADAIRRWMSEPDAHAAAQRNALRFAQDRLSMERFSALVTTALRVPTSRGNVSAA